MQLILFCVTALLAITSGTMYAQDEIKPVEPGKTVAKRETREINPGAIRKIEFDSMSGSISFSANEVDYCFSPRGGTDGVSAGAAVLGELRRASKIILKTDGMTWRRTGRIVIWDMTLEFESLK